MHTCHGFLALTRLGPQFANGSCPLISEGADTVAAPPRIFPRARFAWRESLRSCLSRRSKPPPRAAKSRAPPSASRLLLPRCVAQAGEKGHDFRLATGARCHARARLPALAHSEFLRPESLLKFD